MRRWAVSLGVLALSLACLTPQPRPPSNEGPWAASRDGHTRTGKLYDGLTTQAFVQAVYLPREVREARVARVAAWKVLTVEETERMLALERAEAARFDEFLVTLFTPDRADNDLDTSRTSWRLALVVGGEADRLPESVTELRADALLRELYPAIGDFDVVYRVQFARREGLEQAAFTLRLAGAKGRLDLAYGPPQP